MWPTTCWVGNNSFVVIHQDLSCMTVAESRCVDVFLEYVFSFFFFLIHPIYILKQHAVKLIADALRCVIYIFLNIYI